tara:strand:- start:220 stop:654 length:435 start_codon:yes stop_codon:yes gene_type:complete
MSKQSVFIIVMVSYDEKSDSIAIDPVSVHSDLEVAMNYAEKLEGFNKTNNFLQPMGIENTYDVLEFYLDEPPMLLTLFENKKKELEESVEKTIISLMKKGIVDQLIGEDGYFYYKLTDKGKIKLDDMNLNPLIRKILKRNDEEN